MSDEEMMRQCYPSLYQEVYGDDSGPEQDPAEYADWLYDATKNGDFD